MSIGSALTLGLFLALVLAVVFLVAWARSPTFRQASGVALVGLTGLMWVGELVSLAVPRHPERMSHTVAERECSEAPSTISAGSLEHLRLGRLTEVRLTSSNEPGRVCVRAAEGAVLLDADSLEPVRRGWPELLVDRGLRSIPFWLAVIATLLGSAAAWRPLRRWRRAQSEASAMLTGLSEADGPMTYREADGLTATDLDRLCMLRSGSRRLRTVAFRRLSAIGFFFLCFVIGPLFVALVVQRGL